MYQAFLFWYTLSPLPSPLRYYYLTVLHRSLWTTLYTNKRSSMLCEYIFRREKLKTLYSFWGIRTMVWQIETEGICERI